MAAKTDNAPVIIKKVKKGGHDGHHGGAWKVAYADFVTAMMAFFLLLWLLNVTTEQQRAGISDYFSPNVVSNNRSGSGGILGGRTLSSEGAMVDQRTPIGMNLQLPPPAQVSPEEAPPESEAEAAERAVAEQAAREAEDERFEAATERVRQALSETRELKKLSEHLLIDRTSEGLRIQLVDKADSAMFALGSATPLPRTRKLLELVSASIRDLPNEVTIKGHTDATPFRGGGGYGNWELSADRANASRRALVDAGLPAERVGSVVGLADQQPLLPDDPTHPQNRRISILLKREAPAATPTAQVDAGAGGGSDSRASRERTTGPSILGRDEDG